jgi:hypothetical protein
MKNSILFLFVIVSFCSLLNSVIWEIKQDGTGDFSTIQEGINASSNADTVLVFPGIYYENINYNGKNITVGSLNLITGEEQYISQTIIDGNQNGSCVQVMSGEDSTATLQGFSIVNGSGYPANHGPYGGGVYINNSELDIKNCLIKDNIAYRGGGIYIRYSRLFIEGTKLFNNHAYSSGGAIYLTHYSEIDFNDDDLCNIYLNYAAKGNDIYKASSCPPMIANVDTFTVAENSLYFINSTSSTGVPLNDVILNANHGKIEQVYCDLYVSAEGDNANSGLTFEEPLKTLNYALALLSGISDEVYTVHVANGYYSKSLNQQCFPLNMPGNVSLVGQSMEGVIWDAESLSSFTYDTQASQSYTIKNITFLNSYERTLGAVALLINADQISSVVITFENLIFSGCIRRGGYLIFPSMRTAVFKNITAIDNQSTFLRIHNCSRNIRVFELENIKISTNVEPIDSSIYNFDQLNLDANFSDIIDIVIKNVEITNNVEYECGPDPFVSCSAIYMLTGIKLSMINCTIGNNILPTGAPRSGAIYTSNIDNHVVIHNSILYGDNHPEIYIYGYNDPSHYSSVTVSHSLVEGGQAGIQNPFSWNQVYWLDGNLNTDPLWLGSGDYPYALQSGSPCIDAGTLDLPDGIELPEFDLAGNPRIYGSTVDMGAYEWQGTGTEEVTTYFPLSTHITNYPNPFNPSTTISFSIGQNEQNQQVELSIFNIKGQKVKTLINAVVSATEVSCTWNGKDEAGKRVSSGQYTARLTINGEEKAVRKIMLVK